MTSRHIRPASLVMGLAVIGAMALTVALTAFPDSVQAEGGAAKLSLSASKAKPGDTITVQGSGFRVGTEASFIYTSTITIGGVSIGKVASVDPASGNLHAGRTTKSGLYVAEHIDIDPKDTKADGAFTAKVVLPKDLPAGDHDLRITSCWGGPKDEYPQDGVAPCGTKGLGGGVNDRVAKARITIQK